MNDGEMLLAAILANPEADDPRLQYADWLQEHDQPERAEFIRVQCALVSQFIGGCQSCGRLFSGDRVADGCPCNSPRGVNHGLVPTYVCTCPECDPEQTGSVRGRPADVEAMRERERLLFGLDTRLWFPGTDDWACQAIDRELTSDFGDHAVAYIRRGFVSEVRCTAAAFTEDVGRRLFSRHPVTKVVFPGVVRGDIVFRGGGEGDIDRDQWERFGLSRCEASGECRMRGTHAHMTEDEFSRHLVNYGRLLAGLDPLPNRHEGVSACTTG